MVLCFGVKLRPKIVYKLRGGVRNWVEIYGNTLFIKSIFLLYFFNE